MLSSFWATPPLIPLTALWRKHPIWERKELRLWEVKWLAQELTAGGSQSQHLNPGLSDCRVHNFNHYIVLGLGNKRAGGAGSGNVGMWYTWEQGACKNRLCFSLSTEMLSLLLHTNGGKWLSPALGPVPKLNSLVLITSWQPWRPNMMHKIFLVCGS